MWSNHINWASTHLLSSPNEKILQRLCCLSSFSGLARKELRQIAEASDLIEIKRTEIVYGGANVACDVFIVLSGLVKQVSDGASPLLLGIAGPGQIIGLHSLFERGPCHFTAVALTRCKLARLNADRFLDIMFTNPGGNVRRSLSITIWPWMQTLDRHPVLMAGSVQQRLRAALLELAQGFGTRDERGVILNVPLTHAVLAAMIGAARQTVSRMIADLQRKEIVFRDRRRFTVVIDGLRQFGDEPKIGVGTTSVANDGF